VQLLKLYFNNTLRSVCLPMASYGLLLHYIAPYGSFGSRFGPRLVQLQLVVGAQGRHHVVGGHRHQLVRLRFAQLVQLQLDVQAHLDGLDGGGRRRGHHHSVHPSVLQSLQQEWQL
jgi:hypothetical protein